jgi:uncharacterized lipoprotein YddW (UPF0748 family)
MPLVIVLAFAFVVATAAPARAQSSQPAQVPEVRALWADAFHAGIRSPAEAEQLVRDAKRANLNLLFVQVRRRGDALYLKGVEPPLDDPEYDPSFDALAHIVAVAHRAGLQVHAWINAMPVWRDETPPKDARHVFSRHGTPASGEDVWLTSTPDGTMKFPVGYFLDPGHPGVQAYLPEIYLNIVREYDVDGIHFDYVRYPETETSVPRGSIVGYNATSLARFRKAAGREDTPEPGDEEWMAWRRRQVTNVVRRVYVEAKAIKPSIVVSAAVIPWGRPPVGETDFADVAPMQLVYQDWHAWLQEGLLDLAVPMNYARETDERVRTWFDGWVAWERRHQHARRVVVGLGAYRNTPEHLLAQIARVREADGEHRLAGVSFFSYAAPVLRPDPPASTTANPPSSVAPEPPPGDRYAFLSDGAPGASAAFTAPVPLPPMPWIDRPSTGWIAGVVSAGSREAVDDIDVQIRRTGLFKKTLRVRTDANGFFAMTNVAPGKYRVRVEGGGLRKTSSTVAVVAGRVSRADLHAAAGRR